MPDPDERVRELQKRQAEVEAEITRLKQEDVSLTEEIESSKTTGTAIKEVLAAYTEALPNLIKEFKEDGTYSDTKMRMILCAVEKNKPAIDQKIADYDRQLAAKESALEQLKDRKTDAENQLKQAQKEQEDKDTEYKYWAGLKADIEAKLSDIKELKKQIEAEDDASHPASMYFLALELQKTLQSIKIVCSDDLKHNLYKASDELSKAQEIVRQKESQLATATAALAAAQKEVDDLKDKRRENILKIVVAFDVPAQSKKYQGAKQ